MEIHTHDTSNYERADIVDRLGRIYKIRFDLYQRKFAVKGLNNFLAQVTPLTFWTGSAPQGRPDGRSGAPGRHRGQAAELLARKAKAAANIAAR